MSQLSTPEADADIEFRMFLGLVFSFLSKIWNYLLERRFNFFFYFYIVKFINLFSKFVFVCHIFKISLYHKVIKIYLLHVKVLLFLLRSLTPMMVNFIVLTFLGHRYPVSWSNINLGIL